MHFYGRHGGVPTLSYFFYGLFGLYPYLFHLLKKEADGMGQDYQMWEGQAPLLLYTGWRGQRFMKTHHLAQYVGFFWGGMGLFFFHFWWAVIHSEL